MYKHARTHKFYKTLSVVAVLLTAAAFLFGVSFVSLFSNSAFAAPIDENAGTLLETGNGLSIGDNAVRTNGGYSDTQIYASDTQVKENAYGTDFWFYGGTTGNFNTTHPMGTPNTASFSNGMLSLKYFTTAEMTNASDMYFRSKIKLGSSLLGNLSNNQSTVVFTVSAEVRASAGADAYADSLNLEWFLSGNGTDSSGIEGTAKHIASADWETVSTSATVTPQTASGITFNDAAYFQINIGGFTTEGADTAQSGGGISGPTTGIMVDIRNVKIGVSVSTDENLMAFGPLGIRVQGGTGSVRRADAESIYVQNLSESTEFYADGVHYRYGDTSPYGLLSLNENKVYIKHGDTVFLYSDVLIRGTQMSILPDYAESMGAAAGTMPIEWTFSNSEEYRLFESFDKRKPTEQSANDAKTGRTTEFYYYKNNAHNGVSLTLRPQFITGVSSGAGDAEPEFTYLAASSVDLVFDNTNPSDIVLKNDDGGIGQFGAATPEEALARPYTSSTSVPFTFSSGTPRTSQDGSFAPEKLYYTLTAVGEDADGPLTNPARQVAEVGANGEGKIEFPSGRGTEAFKLQMVVIDAAGNYSPVYTRYICVDPAKYTVSSEFQMGTSGGVVLVPNTNEALRIATLSFHDGTQGNWLRASTRQFGRMVSFSMRIEMTASQFEKYKLVSVRNAASGYDNSVSIDEESLNRPVADPDNWNERLPQIGFYRRGNTYTYTITYTMASYGNVEMDDPNTIDVENRTFDFLSTDAARNFIFCFKERADANVSLTAPEFKFENVQGVPTAIPQGVAVTFNNFDYIDYSVKYYKLTAEAANAGRTITALMREFSTPQAAAASGYVELLGSDDAPELPSLAGEYWYWVYIPEGSQSGHDRNYYIDRGGLFTIQKAFPKVKDVAFIDADGKPYSLVYSTPGGMRNLLQNIRGVGPNGTYSHDRSSIGVPGFYEIKSPTSSAPEYQNPNAMQYTVTVAFNPSDVGGILSADNFRSSEDIMLTLTVTKYEVQFRIAENQQLSITYSKGSPLPFAVEVSFDGGMTFVNEETARETVDPTFMLDYTYKPEGQVSFTDTVPTNAGRYDVKTAVSSIVNNYKGTFVLSEQDGSPVYTVQKERLNIDYKFENNYVYGYFSDPELRAFRWLDEENGAYEWEDRNLRFETVYKKAGESEFSAAKPYDAGEYAAKVKIVAANYEGETSEDIKFSVLKANLTNTGGNLQANFPTALSSASSEVGAHAVYGNRLGDVRLASGNAYHVTYIFGGQTRPSTVAGVFRYAASPEEYETFGLADAVSAELRTHINTPLDAVGQKTVVLLFIPDDLENFEVLYNAMTITVDKTKPDYGEMSFSEIVYGQTFGEAELTGSPYSLVAVYDQSDPTVLQRKETVTGEIRYINAVPSTVYPVGKQEILVEFIPSAEFENRYYGGQFTLVLTVEKQPAEIVSEDVISIVYGFAETLDGNATVNIVGETLLYRVFRTTATVATGLAENFVGEEISFSRRTPAGLYVAEIYIGENSNYSASKFVWLDIDKADASVEQLSEIIDFEIGDDIYSYQSERGWNGFVLALHPDAAFNEIVSGELALVSGQTATYDECGRYAYRFVFGPMGDFAANYNETEIELFVAVSKKTLALSVADGGLTKVYSGGAQYPTVEIDAEGISADDLVWSQAPVNAGRYDLAVRISDDNEKFRGSLEIRGFVIEKDASAELEIRSDKAPWTGGNLYADGAFSLFASSGEPTEYSVSYYDYIGSPVAAMTEVGRYEVRVTLGGNYDGTRSFDFFVIPAPVVYTGAENGTVIRVYNPESTMTGRVTVASVSPVTAAAFGTVEYAALNADGTASEYSQTVPYLAGRYSVRTRFSINGYNGADEGIVLVIEKAQAEITRAPSEEYVYTGAAPEIAVAFRQTGLDYDLAYSADGSSFGAAPNIIAGENYAVRITVRDDNYQGTFVFPYIIRKGEVSLVGEVSVAPAPYGTALDELSVEELTERFDYERAFMFGNSYVYGTFRLTTSGIAALPVWEYEINYVFTPSDPSIEEYSGAVVLSIVRRDISEWLKADENSLAAVYDGRQKTVSVVLKDEYSALLSTSVKNSILASVNVAYDGAASTPADAGTYGFTATLGHVNYSARLTGELTIEKASPEIIAPDPVATLESAVRLSENGVIESVNGSGSIDLNALGSVYAVISANGAPVEGRFSILNAGEISGANRKTVSVRFTPDDTENFLSVETLVYIMLERVAADAEVKISAVALPDIPVYGKTLAEAFDLTRDLTVTGEWSANFAEFGAFRFLTPDFVPSVGTSEVRIVFELNSDYADTYNDKTFSVEVTVLEKAEINVDGGVYLDVRLGETYGAGVFTVPEEFDYLKTAGSFILTEKTGDTVLRADITTATTLGYRYESENYTVRDGRASVKLLILQDEFSVARASAEYRGGAHIEKSELFRLTGISVPDIDSVSGGFSFRIFKDGGEVDYLSDAGVYTVVASIRRDAGIGAGSASFEFVVTPMDLSEHIVLNDGIDEVSTVYLSGVQLFPELTGDAAEIDNVEFLFYYKKAGEADTAFSVYDRPQNAGEYVMRVTVSGNDFYTGSRDYPYTVLKKEVSFTVSSQIYTYGSAREAQVIVSDGLSRSDYSLVYLSEDGVEFRTVPTDAGTYRATVTVTNPNYSGTHTFSYTINRSKTVVSEWVTLGDIVYGQPVSAAVMKLPSVMPAVAGRFELSDGSEILGAGDRTVTVLYIPDNRNYTTESYEVSVRVAKAQTGLNFTVVGAQYTGLPVSPKVAVPGDANLAAFVEFTYFRQVNGNYVPTDAPVLPGTYYVRASLKHDNFAYDMPENVYQTFTVYRAEVIEYLAPTASPVSYGKCLEGNSALTGGYAVYYNGTEAGIRVVGRFSFVNGNVSLGDAGEGKTIKLLFTPENGNYAPFECETTVDVVKAAGSITVVSGASSVYGTPIAYPQLRVTPDTSLSVKYDDGFVAMVGRVLEVGQYTVTARIDDDNYTGEITFTYSVTRAPVELLFTDANGNPVSNYSFEYGQSGARVYAAVADGFVGDEYSEVVAYFDFSYASADGTLNYDSFERLIASAGNYRVTVSVGSGSNYSGSASVEVGVTKRTIDDVRLPISALQEQIYGSVSAPSVEIVKNGRILSGVSYYIDYGDSGRTMPTRAGTYMIMVVVDDADYEPYRKQATFVINKKRLTVTDISVENKQFDGVSGISINGTLSGILLGDEVLLDMKARVRDGEIDPGTYGVDIVSATLKGLDAGNYSLETPAYSGTVTITSNRLYDKAEGGSYIIYGDNVSKDAEFSVGTVESPLNKEGFFSSLLGQKADVMSFSIRENGIKTELSAPVKVYIRIPERFRNVKEITVEGLGNLANAGITFNREGDYITFYTTVSGEIVFSVSEFPYGILFIGIAIAVLIFGFIAIRLLDPARHKLGVNVRHRYDAVKAENARYADLKRQSEYNPPKDVPKVKKKAKKK